MQNNYRTVQGYGEAELEINKSRFIAYVNRAETEAEAMVFIDQIKKQHREATHNCSAYLTGEHDQCQKADDDGEPGGTAGKPILEVIKKSNLKNTVIVVTRYFGGIKLGAGGLIRAYGKAASAGVSAASIIERLLHIRITIEIDYPLLGTVENNLRNHGYIIEAKEFTSKAAIIALVKKGEEPILIRQLQDWTAARALTRCNNEVYVDIPVEN